LDLSDEEHHTLQPGDSEKNQLFHTHQSSIAPEGVNKVRGDLRQRSIGDYGPNQDLGVLGSTTGRS
jgi:hypothetical protein